MSPVTRPSRGTARPGRMPRPSMTPPPWRSMPQLSNSQPVPTARIGMPSVPQVRRSSWNSASAARAASSDESSPEPRTMASTRAGSSVRRSTGTTTASSPAHRARVARTAAFSASPFVFCSRGSSETMVRVIPLPRVGGGLGCVASRRRRTRWSSRPSWAQAPRGSRRAPGRGRVRRDRSRRRRRRA